MHKEPEGCKSAFNLGFGLRAPLYYSPNLDSPAFKCIPKGRPFLILFRMKLDMLANTPLSV